MMGPDPPKAMNDMNVNCDLTTMNGKCDGVNDHWIPAFWFDGLGIPSFAVEKEGKVVAWNRKLVAASRLSVKQVHGVGFAALVWSQDQIAWEKALQDCIRTAEPQTCSVRCRIDNVWKRLRIQLTSNTCAGGSEVVGAVCFVEFEDMDDPLENCTCEVDTPVDQVQVALTDSLTDSEYARFIRSGNLASFGVDQTGTINLWNEAMATLSGFSELDFMGKSLVDNFIPSSLRDTFKEALGKAFLGEGTANYEFEFRAKDGDIRYLLLNVSPLWRGSHVVGAIAVAQDVTEQAQHYRSVTGMARELQQLIDTANTLIFGVDERGYVNEWNDKTAEITGFTGDYAFNSPFIENFIADSHRDAVRSIQESALQGRGTANYELELRTRGNEMRHLLVTVSTRRNAEHAVCGALYIAHDITEASKHDRAVTAMASELRQLIDTANAPIFGIDCDG
jgi:PAS domain S-box-containing protein